jgi:hypothetical protein
MAQQSTATASSKLEATESRVHVTIAGKPPGLIFGGKGVMEADAAEPSAKKKKKYREPQEEAKLRGHWKGTGKSRELCIPSPMLYLSFCDAAKDYTHPANKRKSMVYLLAATIAFEEDRIGLGTSEFECFEDYVRIPPRTGPCVKIGRPRLKEWEASFTIIVDHEMWNIEMLQEIIVHAGKTVGIGAWRPSLKGSHGRFALVKFEVE